MPSGFMKAGSYAKERDPISDLLKDCSLSTVLVGTGQSAEEGACRTTQPPTVPAPEHPTVKLKAPQGKQTSSVACKTSCVSELQDNLVWKDVCRSSSLLKAEPT